MKANFHTQLNWVSWTVWEGVLGWSMSVCPCVCVCVTSCRCTLHVTLRKRRWEKVFPLYFLLLISCAFRYDLWRANCMQQYLGFRSISISRHPSHTFSPSLALALLFVFLYIFSLFQSLLCVIDTYADRNELWELFECANVRNQRCFMTSS